MNMLCASPRTQPDIRIIPFECSIEYVYTTSISCQCMWQYTIATKTTTVEKILIFHTLIFRSLSPLWVCASEACVTTPIIIIITLCFASAHTRNLSPLDALLALEMYAHSMAANYLEWNDVRLYIFLSSTFRPTNEILRLNDMCKSHTGGSVIWNLILFHVEILSLYGKNGIFV